VLAAPAVSRAKMCKERTRAYRYRRGHPDIPCAMVLRLMARSPRRRIRLVTVADGLKDCLNPVGSTHLRQLDTSNGCQDHTVLPYASALFVRRALIAHGLEPALRLQARATLPRPPQPVPTFVTMANAPLSRTGWGRCRGDLGAASSKISENQKYVCC
jgi:hypothetical protein